MNKNAQIVSNRLSLRKPQEESLEVLSIIANELSLEKDIDPEEAVITVNKLYGTFSDFERSFPSLCFSLATGVGKTRLMGAFISYLFLEKGIKNFFVLAPNLTIYQKLIDDLSKPENPKYVFKGIAEFINTPPKVITGDNYNQSQGDSLWGELVKINIFNISKINAEVRGGKEPRIKRLSEYLGDSYFNYLSLLPDLVLLMDESHHYRADSGMNAINELNPILGLELTATPIDSNGNKFKNVVYDYPLALALKDGFVKLPAIATRKNFNPDQYKSNPQELDILKLEDGMRIHEDTKIALDIYSRNTGNRLVKPFVLVVAKDTEHASEIRETLEASNFFDGKYKGKVMEIHSNQRGSEKEENIQRLIDLEKENNTVEIVIHVNMLKEGWDVTNLYTIIPLRASTSVILTEQTLGRGLRLPYGKRTGDHKVDTLTVVAHDKFDSIIEAANLSDSLIKKENIIEINPEDLAESQEVIISSPTFVSEVIRQSGDYKERASNNEPIYLSDSQKTVLKTINSLSRTTRNIHDLNSPDVQKIAYQRITEEVENNLHDSLFKNQIIEQAHKDYQSIAQSFIDNVIPIPRVIVQQSDDIKSGFKDFELDTNNIDYFPPTDEILRKTLNTNENEIISGNNSGLIGDSPVNIIINELIANPQIDYDREADLLFKLANSVVQKIAKNNTDKDLRNIVLYNKYSIAQLIFSQMSLHFFVSQGEYQESEVYPFTQIESHNLSKFTKDNVHDFRETIDLTAKIPSMVFGGYKKACHDLYKFDSKSEKDFSIVLEDDKSVLKWLRPAFNQFSIYWDNNSKRYEPDFIVETRDFIYMIEVKKAEDIEDDEVQHKAEAAKKYCQIVSEYNTKNGGKKWIYAIIPHNKIGFNMDLLTLVNK